MNIKNQKIIKNLEHIKRQAEFMKKYDFYYLPTTIALISLCVYLLTIFITHQISGLLLFYTAILGAIVYSYLLMGSVPYLNSKVKLWCRFAEHLLKVEIPNAKFEINKALTFMQGSTDKKLLNEKAYYIDNLHKGIAIKHNIIKDALSFKLRWYNFL